MTSTVSTATTAGKKRALPKTIADKRISGPGEIADERIGAAAKKAKANRRMSPATISPQERHHLIEVAAHYVAERRAFQGGCCHDDWLETEREVDVVIAAGDIAG